MENVGEQTRCIVGDVQMGNKRFVQFQLLRDFT